MYSNFQSRPSLTRSQIPGGAAELQRDNIDWAVRVRNEPVAGTDRVHHWPRGKVLGGSSSINYMLWVRGHPEDYDAWAREGCTGWSWQVMLSSSLGESHFRMFFRT